MATNGVTKGGCSIGGLDATTVGREYLDSNSLTIQCDTGDGWVYAHVAALKDLRTLTIGTHTWDTVEAGLTVEAAQGCTGTRASSCTLCRPNLMDARVIVTVEEATGTTAPFPALVTTDYARTFRVQLTLGPRPAYEHADGPKCAGDMSLSLDLHLQQNAADWVYDPHGPCMPCE